MGIGSIASTNSMSGLQLTAVDSKSKKFQNEITNAQQQMQKLSSTQELSVMEKNTERQKLQKEISSLNAELKRHQEELSRSQKREAMMAELREDKELTKDEKSEDKIQAKETSLNTSDEKNLPADAKQTGRQGNVIVKNNDGTVILKESGRQTDETTEKGTVEKEAKASDSDTAVDAGLSHKKVHAMVSADSSVKQANRQGTIIAKTRDGIAILKGEMRQDEKRGIDTGKNQAELEKMEKKEQRAVAFQFSTLGEANNTMKSAAETNATGTKDNAQIDAGNNGFNNPFFNAMNAAQEDGWASQQRFFVSLGH